MRNFQLFTRVNHSPSLSHCAKELGTPLLTIGSCFSENIAHYISEHFWPTASNPCGISYNPLSISKTLDMILKKNEVEQNSLFFHNDLWSSFDFHGSFSHATPVASLDAMNNSLSTARGFLEKSGLLVLTFGTAYGHFFKGVITNNCHKLPSTLFERRLISVEESMQALMSSLKKIIELYPSLKVICTVSPVRHLRDSAAENSLSKAVLRCLCNELVTNNPGYVDYFPAYEILMDELRDYRFYESDMIHPSATAIGIIMERFIRAYFNDESMAYFSDIESILKSLNHKPKNSHSTALQEFQLHTKERILALNKRYPTMKIYI